MSKIMIYKLSKLHQKQSILRIKIVSRTGYSVADNPGGGEFEPVTGASPGRIDGTLAIVWEKDSLERSACPSIIRIVKVVAGSVVGSEPGSRYTYRCRDPGTVVSQSGAGESIQS